MKNATLALVVSLAFPLVACSNLSLNTPKLAPNPPASTLSPLSINGKFTGEAHAQEDVGEMSVIFVILRNDTDAPRSILRSRIVGVTPEEKKVSLLPPGEAALRAHEASRPSIWGGALAGAAAGTLGGAAVGGITGAIAGAALGPPGAGAGAAVLAAAGAITGAFVGVAVGAGQAISGARSEIHPNSAILDRQLSDQVIAKASQVDGYLFLPKDNYSHIGMILSSETEEEQELTIPVVTTK